MQPDSHQQTVSRVRGGLPFPVKISDPANAATPKHNNRVRIPQGRQFRLRIIRFQGLQETVRHQGDTQQIHHRKGHEIIPRPPGFYKQYMRNQQQQYKQTRRQKPGIQQFYNIQHGISRCLISVLNTKNSI